MHTLPSENTESLGIKASKSPENKPEKQLLIQTAGHLKQQITAIILGISLGITSVYAEDISRQSKKTQLTFPLKLDYPRIERQHTGVLLLPDLREGETASSFVPQGKIAIKSLQGIEKGLEVEGESFFMITIELVDIARNQTSGRSAVIKTLITEAREDTDTKKWKASIPGREELTLLLLGVSSKPQIIPISFIINPKGQTIRFSLPQYEPAEIF